MIDSDLNRSRTSAVARTSLVMRVCALALAVMLSHGHAKANSDNNDEITVTLIESYSYPWHSINFTAASPGPYDVLRVEIESGGTFNQELHSYESVSKILVSFDNDTLVVDFPNEAFDEIQHPHLGSTSLRVTWLESVSDNWNVELGFDYGQPKRVVDCVNPENVDAAEIRDEYVLHHFKAVLDSDGGLEWSITDACDNF